MEQGVLTEASSEFANAKGSAPMRRHALRRFGIAGVAAFLVAALVTSVRRLRRPPSATGHAESTSVSAWPPSTTSSEATRI
jgi:hypothetical protein